MITLTAIVIVVISYAMYLLGYDHGRKVSESIYEADLKEAKRAAGVYEDEAMYQAKFHEQ